MTHNLWMFALLYGASMIPWFFALLLTVYDADKARFGLFLIDLALTIPAYLFLWWAIGWWSLLVFLALTGVGAILEAFDLNAYQDMF